MTEVREIVARAKCQERCAFMGEPPCWQVDGEWPNPNCDEPGCHAEADAILAALAERGFAVVPVEALEPFAMAADKADERAAQSERLGMGQLSDNATTGLGITFGHLRRIRAMIRAAQEGGE